MLQIKIGSGGRAKKKAKEVEKVKKKRGAPPKPKDEKLVHRVTGNLDRATAKRFRTEYRRLGYTSAEAVREAVMLWIQELDNQRGIA